MKSNKKRILFVLAILTMAVILTCIFAACDKKDTADQTNSNDLGVYYEVVGSSLDKNSYIELKSGNVWYDGEDQGTFKINGGNITLYDGDLELMSGTISNGVLTLNFMGETTVYKKSGSMGSGNVDQKAMIQSIQNGKVDGLTVSLEIDNTVEDVDLSGMITTSKDCSWQLYTSRTATSADAIVTKIIVPKNGNNTYYIVVTSADGKTNRTYTLNVWKNYYVTLSFYTNGSFYTSEQVLTHTTYGSGPSCSVAGYTFNGWGCDGYYVTESKSFNANLTPLTYSAKFDSNGGSAVSDKTATFNKDLSLPTPYRTGYTFLGWYLNGNLYNDSIKYTYANDITFTARWQINSYNVVIKSDNKELGTVQAYNGKKDYNSSVSLSATPKLGCSFVGWFANGTKISTNKTYTINVPAYDVTYVAIFEKDERLANFNCSITENSCVITGVLDKNITTVLIPDYVTGISDYAFSGCAGLTSVTIPNSVTSIGKGAFEGCAELTSVTIGSGVTSIGSYAFSGCYRLIEVYNKSTLSITAGSSSNGYVAYYAKNVYKNEGGSKLTTDENGYVIYTDGYEKILVAYHGTNTKLALPSYITKINQYAFYNCIGLKSVTIPDGVTSIGDSAFSGCTGLTTVNWNATACKSAGSSDSPIFKGCSNLATVNIGDNVKIIPSYAFYNCKGLTSITIPDSVTSIGDSAFSGCEGLTSVTIPDSVTSIGSSAFSGCTELTSIYYTGDVASWCGISGLGNLMSSSRTLYIDGNKVEGELTIPDSVTSIGWGAFWGCAGLTSVTIPDSVTSIGSSAFYGCIGLTSVTIPDSVTSIGGFAFNGCTGLTTVNWNATACTSAGSQYTIFEGCSNLATVNIGDNVKIIPSYAFDGCTGLTNITIPDSVTSIGYAAFGGCSSLESITIPFVGASETKRNGYDQVFGYIFGYTTSDSSSSVLGATYQYYGNYKYYYYYIPSSIKSVTITRGIIPSYAFYNCRSLTSVTIGDSVTSIGDYAFRGCTELTSVTIGNRVTSIGNSAFNGCTGLTSVTIPDSVTSIGDEAFRGCTELTSVTLPFVGASETKRNGYDQVFGYIFGYTTSDSSSSVLGATYQYSGNSKYYHYYIPSSIKSVTITRGIIPSYAFYNCRSLTSVTIGNSVTSIGSSAFSYCTGLTNITIPNSVTSIGSSAFSGCTGLTSVTIGKGVTSIGSSAFYNCKGLTSVTIGNSVTSIGEKSFSGCTGLTSVTIGNGVTSIGEKSFSGCTGLTSVTIGNGVTSIGSSAFAGCSSLESITIPFVGAKSGVTSSDTYQYPFGYIFGTSRYNGGVSTEQYYYGSSTSSTTSTTYYIPSSLKSVTVTGGNILYGAFYNCTGLTNITIGNSVTSIGYEAFSGCKGLTTVNWNAIACTSAGSLNSPIFKGCSNLATVNIGDNVKIIPSYAFKDCTGLTSVTIGNSVTSIGDYAFRDCTGLTSVTIGGSVTSIGSYAFSGCTGLTSVTIPNSVTSIGSSAFSGCTGLTSVTIGNRVTSIGNSAFNGCTGLTSITIPDSVTSIGSSAFYNTAWYNNQRDGLVYAGKVAYKYKGTMPSNTSIVLEEGTLGIAGSAFYNCTELTSITIPDSVTNIGGSAFSYCKGLTSITIPDSVTNIGGSAFSYCTGLTSVTIGGSVTSIGSYAFSGCTGLTSVTIPNSVTSIGSSAFSYCYRLIEVYNKSTLSITAGSSSNGDVAYYAKNVYKNEGESKLTTDENGYVIYTDGDEKILVAYHGTNTELALPSDITKINQYAFYGCTGLKSVTIGGSVTSIGRGAFWDCTGLKSVTIGKGVTSIIGGSAFAGCTELTSITVAKGNTKYHSAGNCLIETESKTLIAGCKNSIIPSDGSVTRIGERAFNGCSSLTSITIPNSVTSIGNRAFFDCAGLTSIKFNGTIKQWNAISKGSDWKYRVPATQVVCTDGTISF